MNTTTSHSMLSEYDLVAALLAVDSVLGEQNVKGRNPDFFAHEIIRICHDPSLDIRRFGPGLRRRLDLQKLLAGKIASASPFVALSTHGIGGSAAPAELETGLQLLHQTFVAPGDEPNAFALLKRQLTAFAA